MNEKMKRRAFLQGLGTSASAIALSSCAISGSKAPKTLTEAALAVEPIVKPESLEKPNLTIGYVPVNDSAPFAVA
ncbi:MAG: twin-arginine translocation pathway signal protein, partial [Waterburya sp.]